MRIAEFDSLRGLAAVAIVVFHLRPVAFTPGWTGVDLFFVLSGYLITGIILKYGGSEGFLRAFYVRRGLRIWPIYYLALGVLVLVVATMPKPISLASLPYYLTYTQNLPLYWRHVAPTLAPFDHTWTLALEEQFYVVWPAMVLLAGRKRVVPLCLATVAVSVMAREPGLLTWPYYSERTLLGRCDGFALGGLMAAVLPGSYRRAKAAGLGLALVLALGYLTWDAVDSGGLAYSLGLPTPRRPSLTILAVGVAYSGLVGLVAMGAGSPFLAGLRWRPLAYLGTISYGLYLYHYPLFWWIDGYQILESQPFRMRVVKLGATLAVAVLSWHFVESPILRWKDRFSYRPDGSDSPNDAAPATALPR